ncbi:MAG: hypothetical protein RLZZ15_1574 [Verrucomicrobiota bacterium]|jgi:acetyl esterase/lipase
MPHPFLRTALVALIFHATAFAAAPAFTPHLPTKENTGGAVLIVTGAASATDAAPLARWLNDRGLAAFTLAANATAADTVAALAQLRARAAEFKISPHRIALLGYDSGATIAAEVAYNPIAAEPAGKISSRPDLVALIWAATLPEPAPLAAGAAKHPPTFLVGSSSGGDNRTAAIDLWGKLRAARSPVDAHFFARADLKTVLAAGSDSSGAWPEMFFNWARFSGLLSDAPRVPVKGMAYLDGQPLPHGYILFTPLDQPGTGPIIGRVLNSTFGQPIGQFAIPADQGPAAGRYKVDVRQNMNRWLSNSFSSGLVGGGRGGGSVTPEMAHFGHHRVLAPSIGDQRSFTKVRPGDATDYIVEFKPGADANQDLRIEVFSGAPAPTANPSAAENIGGIIGGPKNPGQAAYVERIKLGPPSPVPGIPEPILLWPNGAPGALPDAAGVFTDEDKPALYAFAAPAGNNTGAAFLIIPGGAFTNRCMDNEGVQVAKFLNRHGIAGFVLRYRIGPNYPARTISTADGHRALRYIRANAAKLGVTPDRIGTIGFSAGGELQGDAVYNNISEGDPTAPDPIDRVSARANFNALIYGGRNPQKPAEAAPTFLFNTIEDAGHLGVQVAVLNALRGAGVPVEAHFYQVGPHGTAMSPGDPQLGLWPELMVKWLRGGGFLGGGGR